MQILLYGFTQPNLLSLFKIHLLSSTNYATMNAGYQTIDLATLLYQQ